MVMVAGYLIQWKQIHFTYKYTDTIVYGYY